jgi:hypothetical protein
LGEIYARGGESHRGEDILKLIDNSNDFSAKVCHDLFSESGDRWMWRKASDGVCHIGEHVKE